MSTTSRQNSLLVTEDWKKIYQTFRNADFQSYDFETLRKSMIDYLRLYYPEDFNDFIESDEYIALIDVIAFLGQSLAYRTDVNARENFLDTAERRDSILKLARLVNYSPKRSIPSSGLLKFTSVSTTEEISDSNGINLSNINIQWNDTTNSNWLEQFTLVLNATLLNSQVIGKPGNTQVLNGVKTDEYTVNITSNVVPAFPFSESIGGSSMDFEIVSATSINQPYVYEVDPRPVGKFNFLYRNDAQGNSSNNTGFFMFFKQGKLTSIDFNMNESVPNRVLNVGYNNINNSDIWLYNLSANNTENELWKAVPAIAGVNVIYNKSVDRNLYQVNTKSGDQIDLVFGDGSFANIPQGAYRIYFRTSNGSSYKITPDEMQSATISMTYVSRTGTIETLTLRANLNYTVTNASSNESLDDIRQKAPQQYYTQGRMITGEDYNIVPYTSFSTVLKVKSVNRTSSGVSRYLDVNDSSGKYSSTNIFAQDGYLYQDSSVRSSIFTFLTKSNVQQIVQDELTKILTSTELEHFYYANTLRQLSPTSKWNMSSLNTNGSTGYFTDVISNQILQLGYVTAGTTKSIRIGAIIKFAAGTGKYFNAQNNIVAGTPKYSGDKNFIYSSVMQVIGDGTNGGAGNFANGQGPVTLSQKVPTGAVINQIIPVFKNALPATLIAQITSKILAYNNFGLRYDIGSETWLLINEADLNITDSFSLVSVPPFPSATVGAPGDVSGTAKDASWMIRFDYSTSIGYTIYWRALDYIFESKLETKFYFDEKIKIYDSQTGLVIKDEIKILKINESADSTTPLGLDYTMNISKNIVDADGYENQNKVLVTFTDSNVDGLPDNPDIFNTIVNPSVTSEYKLVFFRKNVDYSTFITYIPMDSNQVTVQYPTVNEIILNQTSFLTGQIFYAPVDDKFYVLTISSTTYTISETTDYIYKVGRERLYFQYRHNSPGHRRIDPSPSNIIDSYILTKSYAFDYQNWIRDTTSTYSEPRPPTTDQLKIEYNKLENVKAISDTLILNSAKFKPLFGEKAAASLRATFKIVKNPAMNISDNDIKSSVVNAINTYFSIDNWDFGESFFFSELSAYLHSTLTPNISSVIIVPADSRSAFGTLYQINAEANEILTSSATVNNVEIISAITASQINVTSTGLNTVSSTGI